MTDTHTIQCIAVERCGVCELGWVELVASSLAELESKRFDTLKLLSVGLHHYCRDFNIVSWIDVRNLSLELVKVLLMSTFLNDCLIFLNKFYFEKWLSKFMARNNHDLGSIMLQFLHQINAWKLSYWTRKGGFLIIGNYEAGSPKP